MIVWCSTGTATGGISNAPSGKFVQVSCGKDFSCAITTDGTVNCWGENGHVRSRVVELSIVLVGDCFFFTSF